MSKVNAPMVQSKNNIITNAFQLLIEPKSEDKDRARKEFILNVLLLGAIIISFFAILTATYTEIVASRIGRLLISLSALLPTLVFVFFLICYFLSRKGYYYFAAYSLLLVFYLSATYTSSMWGIDIPAALLIYALLVVMSGILIGSKFAIVVSVIVSTTLSFLLYLSNIGAITFTSSWRNEDPNGGDAIVYSIIIFVIASISWLFNREMEKTLERARKSEHALKLQRDQLEIMVAERTQELKKVQVEKLMQLYRFAEFGKLSSGLFHELVAPLNLISLNLHQARKSSANNELQLKIDTSLDRAMHGTERLEKYIRAARKQIQSQDLNQVFSLNEEIRLVISMLEHKARKEHVKLQFTESKEIKVFGNPLKLNQLITNLVSNGIDAYDNVSRDSKKIAITLDKVKNVIIISVQDWGGGISPNHIAKIYDPLFTTKSFEKGTGIGLSLCKDIIENDFKGTIDVKSKVGVGTTFIITLTKNV